MSGTIALGRRPGNLVICAKVAAHEARLQDGVVRLGRGLQALVSRRAPGARVRIAPDGSLHIDVSVVVRYGTDLRALAPSIQRAVIGGVGRISERPVGTVNVHVAGFELARPERRPYDKSVPQ